MSLIESISTQELKDFIKESLHSRGIDEPTKKAEKVAEVVLAQLEEKGFVSEHGDRSFADVMITAALLHDLFDTEENGWIHVFYGRLYLKDIADKNGVPESVQKAIFETIEAQRGDKAEVPRVRPQVGTPQELFANAVWLVNKYLI